MTQDPQNLRILEALLFAAATPLDEASLAEQLPDDADVSALLSELEAAYAGRGVNLMRISNRWTMRTAEDLSYLLRRDVDVNRRLSRAAIDSKSSLHAQSWTRVIAPKEAGRMAWNSSNLSGAGNFSSSLRVMYLLHPPG